MEYSVRLSILVFCNTSFFTLPHWLIERLLFANGCGEGSPKAPHIFVKALVERHQTRMIPTGYAP